MIPSVFSSGDGRIRCEQLDMVTSWIADFQAANKQPEEEVVFDVLCGDFNFDNCSPGVSFAEKKKVFVYICIIVILIILIPIQRAMLKSCSKTFKILFLN